MEGIIGPAQSMAPISRVAEAAPVREAESRPQSAPAKPAPDLDEYVPEEEHTPSGLYWLGKDEDGSLKVFFDDPEGKPAETCTTDTGKVDRELERLRHRREELARQVDTQADPVKAQKLEQELARVEAELVQKDNDTYRRQHAVIS